MLLRDLCPLCDGHAREGVRGIGHDGDCDGRELQTSPHASSQTPQALWNNSLPFIITSIISYLLISMF